MSDPEGRRTEGLKLMFEILKQQATLDTAAALVVIAFGREFGASVVAVVLSLVLFGVSIVLCLFGMLWVAAQVGEGTEGKQPLVLLALSSSSFISGLMLFALYTLVLG